MLDDFCVVCVFSEVKMTRLMWVETNLTSVCGFFRLQRRRSPSRPSWGLSPPSARRFVSPNKKKTLSISQASFPARIETMVTLGQLLINPFYEEHDLCILITFFLKPECLLWFWPNHIFSYGPGTRRLYKSINTSYVHLSHSGITLSPVKAQSHSILLPMMQKWNTVAASFG